MALPKDENGMEIARGDLVLLDDRIYKVVDWEEIRGDGLSKISPMIEIVNVKGREIVDPKEVLCLGPDEISGLKKLDLRSKVVRESNGKDKKKKNGHSIRFYSGDMLHNNKIGLTGLVVGTWWGGDICGLKENEVRVEVADSDGIITEIWESSDCIISSVDGSKFCSQLEVGSMFGGGYRAYGSHRGTSCGTSRATTITQKPKKKKDSITKHDMINQECRRLHNEERRYKILGSDPPKDDDDESSKSKIKTRKGSW